MAKRRCSLEDMGIALALADFYKGRKVFMTGHTGFKGSWLSFILANMGAKVMGYALKPSTKPALFDIADIGGDIQTVIGDVRDFDHLRAAILEHKPEVVFHLAAQPLVLEGYERPRETYDINVMGTVNLLEAVRQADGVWSLLNVTTDKVYLNNDKPAAAFKEDDPLDGFDPYSNSKSCSELVTHSYAKSFLTDAGCAVSTARAGNVIGGGDFSDNRIVPDCVRAFESGEPLKVRNVLSTRPYQHVLEPLFAYLLIAQQQYEDPSFADSYNVGPDECDCVNTGDLVALFAKHVGSGFEWVDATDPDAPHEAAFLKLDSTKMKRAFNWAPRWHIGDAVEKTVEWTRAYLNDQDVRGVMESQISDYLNGGRAA